MIKFISFIVLKTFEYLLLASCAVICAALFQDDDDERGGGGDPSSLARVHCRMTTDPIMAHIILL